MRKKQLLILILLTLVMALSLALASCDLKLGHTHKFSTSYDNEEHWRQCSCGERTLIEAHKVEEWKTTVFPTLEQEGKQEGTCTICKRTVTKTLEKLDHAHSYAQLKSDENGHWYECSCGDTERFQTHSVSQWTVVKPATQTETGLRNGSCSVCEYKVEQVIPVIGHEHDYADTWSFNDSEHWKECPCGEKDSVAFHTIVWITDVPATTTSTGLQHSECSICHMVDEENVTIDMLTSSTRTIDFYAVNDFHGTVDKMSQFGGYLKSCKNENGNTLILNSGDMFQGSMESNSNYGKLLSDCMGVAGFDAFTFGNHEFDWGLDNLRQLASASPVPFLGANIYNWNAATKQFGTFASDLAKEYEIKVLPNGLKVGIIGVIGSNQITSICSNLVQTIGFKDPLPVIKDVSTRLRSQHGCDVVVVSVHAGADDLDGSQLGGYVDAVFTAHTHQFELGTYANSNIPYIQSGSNGSAVSHIQLSVDENNNVTCEEQDSIYYSDSWPNLAAATALIDNSNAQIEEERNQVLARFDGYMSKAVGIPRLVSRAIAEYATDMGHEIVLSMVNTARGYLSAGNVTYSNLYEVIPFDNIIYIAEVSGADILKEAEYSSESYGETIYSNAIWRVSGVAIERNKTYKIAVIDYLLYHQNADRDYNYFPSAFANGKEPTPLTPANNPRYNYRDITKQFLLDNANSFKANDYMEANNHNDNSLIRKQVTFSNGGSSGGQNDGTHLGTQNDPYSVADALILAATASSNSGAPSGFVKGTVSKVNNIKQASSGDLYDFYIKDENGNEICVYYLKKYQNASSSNNWEDTSAIQVGDELVLYAGSIFTYNGSKAELYQCYCVTINGQTPA